MTFRQLFRDVRYMIIFGLVFGITNVLVNGLVSKSYLWLGLSVIMSFIILSAVYGLILKLYFGPDYYTLKAVMTKLAVLAFATGLTVTFFLVLLSSFFFMALSSDSRFTYTDLITELYLKPDVLLNVLITMVINSILIFAALIVGSWIARRGRHPETPTINPPNNI